MNFWWSKTGDLHEDVMSLYSAINEEQKIREDANLKNLRLYGNYYHAGLSSSRYAKTASTSIRHRVTLNVIQSMCDTVTAKIAKKLEPHCFIVYFWDQIALRPPKPPK